MGASGFNEAEAHSLGEPAKASPATSQACRFNEAEAHSLGERQPQAG